VLRTRPGAEEEDRVFRPDEQTTWSHSSYFRQRTRKALEGAFQFFIGELFLPGEPASQ